MAKQRFPSLDHSAASVVSAAPSRIFLSRRGLLTHGATCLSAALLLTGYTELSYSGEDLEKPTPAELELAGLGRLYQTANPAASSEIEQTTCRALALEPGLRINLATAREAFVTLTDKQRVASELERGDVSFAGGWLLTHSELAATLMFSRALSAGDPDPKDIATK